MKKTYRLIDLDCAHCAQKMEEAIGKIDGVISVKINFVMQKLKIELDEERQDEIIAEVSKIIAKIEPDCKLENV